MYKKAPLLTGMVSWEDRFRGEFCHGHVLLLYSDGCVWGTMAFQNRDGLIGFRDGKPRQRLDGLAQEYGKDKDGMAGAWRRMVMNREEGYELVRPLELEALRKM